MRFLVLCVAAGSAVAAQVAYPLVHGDARRAVIVAVVLLTGVASCAHAWWTRGWPVAAALLIVCGGGGLLAEIVGSRTGVPFGHYRYGRVLGPRVAGVPVIVPLAWMMMAWPALLAGSAAAARRVRVGRWRTVVIGALVLASWDLFLDSQMVGERAWTWLPTAGPTLHGIPIVNTAGWLAVASAMLTVLVRVVPRAPRPGTNDAYVWLLLGWTWFSQTLGHLAFFGTPRVALTGGAAMGIVVLFAWRNAVVRRP